MTRGSTEFIVFWSNDLSEDYRCTQFHQDSMHVLSYIEHAQFIVYATAELYIIYFLVGIYDESRNAAR